MHRSLQQMGVVAATLLVAASLRAEVPRFVDLEGFGKLLEGDPNSVALSEEGGIALRPAVTERFAEPGLLFGAAGTFGSDVVLAKLGASPSLVAIDGRGHMRSLYPLGNKLVTAIGEHAGAFWAATSERGKAQLLQWPQLKQKKAQQSLRTIDVPARFVWGLTSDKRGDVLLATGEPGAVMRLDGKGRLTTLFAAEEAHIKAIAFDGKLGLIAGGGERGIVYHAANLEKVPVAMRAVYDTGNQEVTSIKSDGEHVFVASVTGHVGASSGGADAEGERRAQAPLHKPSEVRSTLVKLSLDGSAEMLAASADEILYDLAFDGHHRLLVATGALGKGEPRGRLYRVETARKMVSLLYQSGAKRIVRLLPQADQTVLVEQEGARLVTLGSEPAASGTYLSAAIDTGVVSRFGLVQLLGDVPAGSSAELSVRTGQTAEPDRSWSAFSKPIAAPGNASVAVPNGRYVQLRLTLAGRPQAQPVIYKARLAYLRQNLPPFIQDIFALPRGQALYPLPPGMNDEGQNRVVVLAGKGDEGPAGQAAPRKAVPRARQVAEAGAVALRWLVDEPNGDELAYKLSVRAAGETDYRLVAEDIAEPFHTFHGAQLADGWYVFRVEASDARSNPAELAKIDVRDSRAMLIDNTPPQFRDLKAAASKGRVTITGSVSDRLSPIVSLEAALDGGPLRPVAPADGLLDGLRENISITLPHDLEAGSHTVTLRARDEADNLAHAFVRFAQTKGRT